MTMHIDEAILDRVMKSTGARSKTHAIDIALREMVRRDELKRLAAAGLGLSADELKEAFDPASAPEPSYELNEKPVTYGRKSRSR